MKTSLIFTILAFTMTAAAQGQSDAGQDIVAHWIASRPDAHAPIGVMGDHTHHAGEWMVTYRYMTMNMNGNRDGSSRLNERDVFAEGFMVVPTKMTMGMHMFGAMYAPIDSLTFMAMLPYLQISMEHVTRMGGKFSSESEGIGDLRLTGLYAVHRWNRQQLHFNAGIGFPTGSIDKKADTPAGSNQKLPYPMQLGSGTFDLFPGITYLGQADNWSWGSQLEGTFRLGKNHEGYSLGNRVVATVWGARKCTDWLSASLRLNAQAWGNINGHDDDLNPAMVPTADPRRRGGEQMDLTFGVNLRGRAGLIKGHRLAIEAGTPIYQSLDGPQLEKRWLLTAGWQYGW
jgi:hypothetical protein